MDKRKHILILTADAGFGHRSAANAIAAALQETHGDDCAVEVANPLQDERVPAVLRDSPLDYDRLVREAPGLYRAGYTASDAAVPTAVLDGALALMLFTVLRDLVRRYRPDAIVTPYPLYQAPLGAIYTVERRRIPLLTVVTDLTRVHRVWFNAAADLCLVPTPALCDQAVAAGLAPDKVKVTGIPVHPNLVREGHSRASARAELGWRPDLPAVLAVGSRRVQHLTDVLRALNHSGLPLQLAVVAGGDDDLYRQLQTTEWHVPAHVYNYVNNMPTLMHAADCALSKAGGLIVSESLACGLPMLLVDVLPGQEEGNAEYVIQAGAGAYAQQPVEVLETMYHWLAEDGKRLAQCSQNARLLGRPRAAYEVAELAWGAARRGAQPAPDTLMENIRTRIRA